VRNCRCEGVNKVCARRRGERGKRETERVMRRVGVEKLRQGFNMVACVYLSLGLTFYHAILLSPTGFLLLSILPTYISVN
jgi:hypothetical protein